MSTQDDVKATKALERAMTVLLISKPFWGVLAMQLRRIKVDDPAFVNTMAVDGKHLYYHPPFVNKLTEQELLGVCAHEVSHCAYLHITRRGNRHPTVWNWAGDYVINQDLLDAGFTLLKDRLHDPRFKG